MSTPAFRKREESGPAANDGGVFDAEIERYLVAHHDEIDAKLKAAQASIARGDAAPLEPLAIFLEEARRQTRLGR